MQGLSLSSLWCNDITIDNIYHGNRNLSKVNRAPQKDHVCVAISAIVVGRLDFKERAFYFCGVLTVLSLLHTRSYWLNICLQSKGDFEKSSSPNLLYFSACAVEATETHYSGIDLYIFPERGGDWRTWGLYLYQNMLPNLSPPPLKQCNILSSVGGDWPLSVPLNTN